MQINENKKIKLAHPALLQCACRAAAGRAFGLDSVAQCGFRPAIDLFL